ncbi:MAG: glutamine synthetase type III, partial [Sphingobacteriaceae bacterium]|nr:glutamine synthetase type III [Sphingobacteriaceae bacterium]
SVSNDHRLGANEAPPAIISIFLGQQLDEILDEIETARISKKVKEESALWLGIPKIPQITLDNTDRNRTSPFAFTGNKFELRAVGSSANSSAPMTVLNAIVADQLVKFKVDVDKLIKKGDKKDVALLTVIKRYIKESKDIRFEGNGYGQEWADEAEKRGLTNIKTTPKALDAYISEKTTELFAKTNVFNKRELHARHEILLESFFRKLQIEARVMGEIANTQVLPAAIAYQNILMENAKGLKDLGLSKEALSTPLAIIESLSKHIFEIKSNIDAMLEARKKTNTIEDNREKAISYDENVKVYFDTIRYHVNKLEQIVDDSVWPLPKLREILFLK